MEETLVRVGLFVHIASACGLLAGIAGELLAGHLLTRAEDTSQVRVLANAAGYSGILAALSLVGLLFSGPDLASRTGFFEGDGVRGWIAVAILVIVVIGGMGGGIHRKAFKQAKDLAGEGVAAIPAELRAHLAKPIAWVSMHAAAGLTLATIWNMSNKPSGVVDAIVATLVGGILGAVAGSVVARQTAARLG